MCWHQSEELHGGGGWVSPQPFQQAAVVPGSHQPCDGTEVVLVSPVSLFCTEAMQLELLLLLLETKPALCAAFRNY